MTNLRDRVIFSWVASNDKTTRNKNKIIILSHLKYIRKIKQPHWIPSLKFNDFWNVLIDKHPWSILGIGHRNCTCKVKILNYDIWPNLLTTVVTIEICDSCKLEKNNNSSLVFIVGECNNLIYVVVPQCAIQSGFPCNNNNRKHCHNE